MCTNDLELLKAQWVELNNRSRMYAVRFWHIPFAYIGVVGVVVALVVEKGEPTIQYAAFVLFFLGLLVVWLMGGTLWALNRSVEGMRNLEDRLNLPVKSNRYRLAIDLPNFLVVIIISLLCAAVAFCKFAL